MIKSIPQVTCDGHFLNHCKYYEIYINSALINAKPEDYHIIMDAAGWRKQEGKDYCPSCHPKLYQKNIFDYYDSVYSEKQANPHGFERFQN
jgi:hypothetical protein